MFRLKLAIIRWSKKCSRKLLRSQFFCSTGPFVICIEYVCYSNRHNHTVYSNTPRRSEMVTPYSIHITKGPVEQKNWERSSFLLHFLLHLMANFGRNMSWTILSDKVLWSFRPYKLWLWQHVVRETENLNTEIILDISWTLNSVQKVK
jgi:hypothetical protein